MNDPDTKIINDICKNLVNAKIKINYKITLNNGDVDKGIIKNSNIVGNCMEDILLPYLKKNIPTIQEGPK